MPDIIVSDWRPTEAGRKAEATRRHALHSLGPRIFVMFRNALLSAALLTTVLAGAASAEPFSVMSQGENFSVSYADDSDNIVGGGRVSVIGNGNSMRIVYAEPGFAQQALGIPVFTGGSEGDVAYLMPSSSSFWRLSHR
jgi:hypothetical protein